MTDRAYPGSMIGREEIAIRGEAGDAIRKGMRRSHAQVLRNLRGEAAVMTPPARAWSGGCDKE